MSLLSDFLGTEDYSIKDLPLFEELIRNLKSKRTSIGRDDLRRKRND